MHRDSAKFLDQGFLVLNSVVDDSDMQRVIQKCEQEIHAKVGTRNLLKFAWVRELAQILKSHSTIAKLLPDDAVAVQCNYFSKDTTSNWHVALHRDLSIPVKRRIDSQKWSGWSEKEGTLYVQPPRHVLENMVSIRLHLEDNNADNGALELVCGSHQQTDVEKPRVLPTVSRGGALIMRPLILHSSSKLKSGRRRVLHFVFGPNHLPDGAEWAVA